MSTLQASAQHQLRQFIEQIEKLEEEKKALSADIRDKYKEAKAVGFDVKAMRQIIKLRKKTNGERSEEESILDVYLHALGMLDETKTTMTSRLAMEAAAPSVFPGTIKTLDCPYCGVSEGQKHEDGCAMVAFAEAKLQKESANV